MLVWSERFLPSMESTEKKSIGLNLKATELRLGLPGSESPERDVSLVVCGAKRCFSEAPQSTASLLPKPLHHDNNKPHLSAPATKYLLPSSFSFSPFIFIYRSTYMLYCFFNFA